MSDSAESDNGLVAIDEETIKTPYMSDEVVLDKITPIHFMFALIRINAWKNISHHPTCSRYDNHLFRIGKLSLCVGCTSLYSTWLVYLLLFFLFPVFFQHSFLWVNSVVFLIAMISAFLHLFLKPKNKWLKSLFRGILGFGLGGYTALIILVPNWWIRSGMTLLFFLATFTYNQIRGSHANIDLCSTCPLSQATPPCDPFENTNLKIKKLKALLDSELEKIDERKRNRKILNDIGKLD